MDQKYDFDGWSSRWDEDRIGFHAVRPNPFLLQYWQHLDEIKPKRCLVPLCGKSLDLVWLSEKIETVIGVELVEKAVLDFFREQQIIPEIQKNSPCACCWHPSRFIGPARSPRRRAERDVRLMASMPGETMEEHEWRLMTFFLYIMRKEAQRLRQDLHATRRRARVRSGCVRP